MALPTLLEKLAAYVPNPVVQAVYRHPHALTEPTAKRFSAAVLFTDISGFTPLSELLSQVGATGAEELTLLINKYFTQMIDTVQAYRGQVVKFSGDALTVIFPVEEISPDEPENSDDLSTQRIKKTFRSKDKKLAVRYAGECALAMQSKMGDFARISTSRGIASFSMKVGIGVGQILACSIGGALGRWEYLVAGDPLVQVAMAEHMAQPGQIIFSSQAWAEVQEFFSGEVVENQESAETKDFVVLHQSIQPLPKLGTEVLDWSLLNEEQQVLVEQALKCYIPGAIKARLGEQAEWLAELRRMTIVFLSVVGFDYDSDGALEQLQTFLQTTQELVYRFEGSLNKVAVDDKGTICIILFGAPPFSHEDDARRAVACALDLQIVAKSQNLEIAVGIAEGSIFAGPVGAPTRREYTVIGDQVNLAARLMQHGRPSSIIINDRVKERAGPHFIIEDLGQISIKGKAKTLSAYRVKGERDVQDEFVIRHLLDESILIGREVELEVIRGVAKKAQAEHLQILFLEGGLGVGKSRFASEMVREWMMAGGVGYGSKCVSYGQQIPYQAWREVLMAIHGLTPNLTPERQLTRLEMGIADLKDPPGQPNYWAKRLPLLAESLGIDTPENGFTENITGQLRRNNTFALIEAILRRQAQRHTLLILLEDIQWGDELSLSLIKHICITLMDTPMLLVLIHRPMADTILAEIKQLAYTQTLHLAPLSANSSQALLKTLLNSIKLPLITENALLTRGQGNPFFLQEIARTVLDVIAEQPNEKLDQLELNLPDTIQDVILSRVDQLSPPEKITLKIASVIGPRFQRSLVVEVHPMGNSRYFVFAQLDSLEKEELIRLEVPSPKWEYMFYNVTTQEVVYEGLLLSQRKQLHAEVGKALEKLVPDEIEQLAYHYGRSNNLEKALYYLNIAAQKTRREYANQAAIGYYSSILTCLDASYVTNSETNPLPSVDYWDYLMERAKLYNLIGERTRELEDLDILSTLAEKLNDNTRMALVAKQWVYVHETNGDYSTGLKFIERSVELAKKAHDERLVGEGYSQWGKLLYLSGEYEPAFSYLQQALLIAQNHHDKKTQADCLNSLGMVAHFQTDFEVALYFFDEAIDLRREAGNQVGLAHSLSNLGEVYYDMGQYMAALKCFSKSLALHRTIGDRAGEANTRYNLGRVYRRLGSYEKARELLEESRVIQQSVGDRRSEACCLYHLGFLHTRLKEYDQALLLLGKALEVLRDVKDLWSICEALTYYGWTRVEQGQYLEAKEYFEEARQTEYQIQLPAAAIEDLAHLARVALVLNDLSTANAHIQEVLIFLRRHGTQGIEHPTMVYLICYQVLQATQNFEQAKAILEQGQQYITKQIDQINEPALQQSFRDNIPENVEIMNEIAHYDF